MTQRDKLKAIFSTFLLVEVLFTFLNPTSALAQTQTATVSQGGGAENSIRALLCTPTDTSNGVTSTNAGNYNTSGTTTITSNSGGDDLYVCINKLYKFAIAFSVIGAVFMITIAGYLYMASDGSEESVTKAKEILVSSITALVILFIAFILLREINPELTKFKVIQPGYVTGGVPGSTGNGAVNGRNYGTGRCEPITNAASPAAVANLRNTCFGSVAEQASSVANGESNGNPLLPSGVDICNGDGSVASWGLFQINLTVHKVGGLNCPAAFSSAYTGSNHSCRVVNRDLYNQCVAAAKTPATNIEAACQIYRAAGNRWRPWGFYLRACQGKF